MLNQNQGDWYSGVLGDIIPQCGLSNCNLTFVMGPSGEEICLIQFHVDIEYEGKRKLLSSIFLQVYNSFCSCAMYFAVLLFFADVLNLCIIPTYNFDDVQLK